jgi:hypothetical protein
MEDKTIETETRIYLYDLMNTAKEFGFKADDNWEFSLATSTERTKIEREYYPTIAAKIIPEILLQVLHSIKSRLKQSLTKDDQMVDMRSALSSDTTYLVAYNPKRPRT